jgi:acetate kinase
MRRIERRAGMGDSAARLALKMFCYRLKKYIGAYHAALGGLDGIIFTGGIGENSPLIREMSCEAMNHLGIVISHAQNHGDDDLAREISGPDSAVKILVIPTNEELEIATQTMRLVANNDKQN